MRSLRWWRRIVEDARPARRAGQQRGRRAEHRRGDRVAAVPRQDRGAQPAQPAARRPGRQRVMQRQDGGGSIVNISSISAHRPAPTIAAYAAAKAGLDVADPVAGHGVGPEGPGQRDRSRACAAPSRPTITTATTTGSPRSRRPSRSAGWPAARGRPRRRVPGQRPGVVRLRRPGRLRRRRGASRIPAHQLEEKPCLAVRRSRRDRHRSGPRDRPRPRPRAGSHGAEVVVNDYGVTLAGEGRGESPADEVVGEIEATGGEPWRTAPMSPISRTPRRWCGRPSTPSVGWTFWSTTPASSATGCSSTPARRSGTR